MAEAPRPWLAIVVILVLIAAGGGLSGYLWYTQRPQGPTSVLTVQVGDNVTVNYIGTFGSGPQLGRVFDTSVYSVAINDGAWPKGLEYTPRGAEANYTPLPVYVGSNAPSGGYSLANQSFVSVVTGFWQGLLGLPGNQTRTIRVPPSLGYGPSNPACIVERPIVENFPILQTFSRVGFSSAYPGVNPATGATFADPHYPWNILIYSTNASSITTMNLAQVGATTSPGGWPIVVTNVSSSTTGSGTITVRNELNPNQAGLILGYDFQGNGPCRTQTNGKFIVTSVNVGAGTYTADFNTEVTGQTLLFTVTPVNIFPPGKG